MRRRGIWVWAVSGAVLAGATTTFTASAEPIENRVRLSLENGIAEYTSLTTSATGYLDLTTTRTSLSLASTTMGPGVAYGLNDNVMIGGRLSFVSTAQTYDADVAPSQHFVGGELDAVVEYVIGEGAMRPFFSPFIGYTVAYSNANDSTFSALVLGIQGGVHGFATPSFSIDPSVLVAVNTGSSHQPEQTFDVQGITAGLRIAVSGWLGGKSTRTAEPPLDPVE